MTMLSPYDPEIEALWRAVGQAQARSVALVSSLPGEGTTMIASALARRAGLAGKPALLVDLNLIRPGLARLFGLQAAPGEIVTLPAFGLSVMPNISDEQSRAWREPGALARQAVEWSDTYGLVVFDTAPVLSRDYDTVPGVAAAAAADAAILATLAGRTPVPAIRDARARLDVAGARLIGTVMNDRDNPTLLTELERETYRLAPRLPRAMAMFRDYLRRSTLLTVRV